MATADQRTNQWAVGSIAAKDDAGREYLTVYPIDEPPRDDYVLVYGTNKLATAHRLAASEGLLAHAKERLARYCTDPKRCDDPEHVRLRETIAACEPPKPKPTRREQLDDLLYKRFSHRLFEDELGQLADDIMALFPDPEPDTVQVTVRTDRNTHIIADPNTAIIPPTGVQPVTPWPRTRAEQ